MAKPFVAPVGEAAPGGVDAPLLTAGGGSLAAAQPQTARPGDGMTVSDEARESGEAGASNALAQRIGSEMWSSRLAAGADSVINEQDRAAVDSVNGAKKDSVARDQLLKDVEAARKAGARISPEVEALLRRALGNGFGGFGGDTLGGNGTGGLGDGGLGGLGGGGFDGFGGGGGDGFGSGGGYDGSDGGGWSQVDGGGGGGWGAPPNVDRQWSDADRAFLERSLQSDPEHFRGFNSEWRQGGQGNCASVATIKAAMDRYDNKVFDEVKATEGGGYDITMQDGYRLNLSRQEMDLANSMSDFRGNGGEAQAYATLCYGAIGKRAQMENGGSYRGHLQSLNSGYNPNRAARYLGLGDKTVHVNPHTLNGQDSCVAWSGAHAVFVDRDRAGNHTADRFGQQRLWDGTDQVGNWASHAFTLQPRAYPSEQHEVGPLADAAPRQGSEEGPSTEPQTSGANERISD